MLVVGERRLADPRDAFAAHLTKGAGAAVHPHGHVVTADAGHCTRAFRHVGRRVVRAAGAEPRLALHFDTRPCQGAFLRFDNGDARGNPGAHIGRQIELVETRGDGLGDDRRRQFIVRGQQPFPHRNGPLAAGAILLVELAKHARTLRIRPVVQLFLDGVFEDLTLLFDHQNFFQTACEGLRALRFQRPDAAHLVQADADARAGFVVEAEVGERLAHIEIGLAAGHDAEARMRCVDLDAIQLVCTYIGESGVPLVVEQTRFLNERRIGPTDVEATLGHAKVFGQDDLGAVRIDIHRG